MNSPFPYLFLLFHTVKRGSRNWHHLWVARWLESRSTGHASRRGLGVATTITITNSVDEGDLSELGAIDWPHFMLGWLYQNTAGIYERLLDVHRLLESDDRSLWLRSGLPSQDSRDWSCRVQGADGTEQRFNRTWTSNIWSNIAAHVCYDIIRMCKLFLTYWYVSDICMWLCAMAVKCQWPRWAELSSMRWLDKYLSPV
jgi:hypothetical protein